MHEAAVKSPAKTVPRARDGLSFCRCTREPSGCSGVFVMVPDLPFSRSSKLAKWQLLRKWARQDWLRAMGGNDV